MKFLKRRGLIDMSDQIQQNLQSILRWSLNVQGGGNEARESSGTDEEVCTLHTVQAIMLRRL